jgi:hypothetical protein
VLQEWFYFPVSDLDEKDLLVRELQQLKLAYQKLQDHVLTKEGEVSLVLCPAWTLNIILFQLATYQNVWLVQSPHSGYFVWPME